MFYSWQPKSSTCGFTVIHYNNIILIITFNIRSFSKSTAILNFNSFIVNIKLYM